MYFDLYCNQYQAQKNAQSHLVYELPKNNQCEFIDIFFLYDLGLIFEKSRRKLLRS